MKLLFNFTNKDISKKITCKSIFYSSKICILEFIKNIVNLLSERIHLWISQRKLKEIGINAIKNVETKQVTSHDFVCYQKLTYHGLTCDKKDNVSSVRGYSYKCTKLCRKYLKPQYYCPKCGTYKSISCLNTSNIKNSKHESKKDTF